jgi:uncharacterized protein involved in outer membrane biogenesis
MPPLLRITVIIVGIVALLLAAVAIVVSTMDLRTLLSPIETQLEQATGRDITLGTTVDLDLSLTPTLELTDFALGNAPWGTAKEMIRAKRVEAQVALLPLLSRRVDLVRLTLIEPVIVLETDAQGQGNWAFGKASSPSKPSDPIADSAAAFGLGEFALERGDVRFRDGRSGETTQIRIDRLYVRARDPNKAIVAEFKGTVGDVPLAIEGTFGPLAALRAQQWPWPVSVKGDVAGRKTEVTTKLRQTPDGIEAGELMLAVGTAVLRGNVVYSARSPRPLLRFTLAGDTLVPRELALAGGAAVAAAGGQGPPKPPAAPAPKPDGRLFSSAPVSFKALSSLDAQGELSVAKLVLGDGRDVTSLRARIALDDSRLDVSEFSGNALGGSARGRLLIDARNAKSPAIALNVTARELDLAALMASAGVKRDVKGGKTRIDMDIEARGTSMRAWASSLGGRITASVGPARWISTSANLPSEIDQLASAFNPLRTTGSATELKCVGLRLPFSGGVARTERGIGLETDQLGVAASGTIDLGRETLDLLVHPRIKDRAGIDLARISGAVRIQGSLDAPRVTLNPVGTIAAAGDIASLLRGGRSAVIGALAPTAQSGPGECAVAVGTAPAPRAPEAAARAPERAPSRGPADEVNRALNKLLGR